MKWKGHVNRMSKGRIPKEILFYQLRGQRWIGHPMKRWGKKKWDHNRHLTSYLTERRCYHELRSPNIFNIVKLTAGGSKWLIERVESMANEVPRNILLCDLKGFMRLDRNKDISVHVQTCISYSLNALTPVVWKFWRW